MPIDKKLVSRSFDKVAAQYDKSSFLQQEIASRLLERLDLMSVKPNHILDAGCATGATTKSLSKKFPKAIVCGVDISPSMIKQAIKNKGFFDKSRYQVADLEQLPFSNNQFDLVFSNLTLVWVNDIHKVLLELNRVLKPGGLLVFSTFATDTLTELKQSWSQIDNKVHINQFFDMHVIGDQVYKAQFENVVMDRDIITLTYKTLKGLMKEIKATGSTNINLGRSKGLQGKQGFDKLVQHYQSHRWEDGQLPATFEVVYGHGWKSKEIGKGDYHTYKVKMA